MISSIFDYWQKTSETVGRGQYFPNVIFQFCRKQEIILPMADTVSEAQRIRGQMCSIN